MLIESFKITGSAVGQIFLLATIGYILVKKDILGPDGLNTLSRLVMEVTLPILIFCQLIRDFSFSIYPNWWFFPLLSVMVNVAGFLLGLAFIAFIRGREHRIQFLSLNAFQNSGYLPLALVAALLPKAQADIMFIYLFLFLMGFNALIWSVGVYMLTFTRAKKFELGSFFSPPVIATVLSLILIYFGLNRFVPGSLIKPLRLAGDCTLPLAMFVVGGNLAQIQLKHIEKKAMFYLMLAKMIILPLLGLSLILHFKLPQLVGLLLLIQLAAPPATLLSVIIGHYKKEDLLVSQGIFWGHIASLITLPVFLSLYFMLVMIK